MNSLYGRFGLNPWLGECVFMSKDEYTKLVESGLLKDENLEDKVEFNNHYLIEYRNNDKFGLQSYLPIAIAVTAYSRIFMSTIKNREDITICYSDTDSSFIYLSGRVIIF